MSWANAQAEKSRLERGLSTPADIDMTFEDQMNGLQVDRGSKDVDLPLAERAFVDLLAASDELTNVRIHRIYGYNESINSLQRLLKVIKLHGDAERASREQKEIRYAQEKSKTDTRMGRSVSKARRVSLQYSLADSVDLFPKALCCWTVSTIRN